MVPGLSGSNIILLFFVRQGSGWSREQALALSLLVSRVEYDAEDSAIEVSFHPTGIRTLTENHREEAA